MKVIHIGTNDEGGAYQAMVRISKSMELCGAECRILLRNKENPAALGEEVCTGYRRLFSKIKNFLNLCLSFGTVQSDYFGEDLTKFPAVREADVIFLHCPLFPSTEGIINKENIAKMKDGVILINNSRGQLVVEQDLADALNSGKVYAAGLDVVSTEPIRPDNPLKTAKNTIITPHISWAAQAARQRIMDITVDNIRSYVEGKPVNVVNR